VDRLGPDADLRKVEQTVAAAVSSIEAHYGAEKAAEADAAERERLLRWIPLELREFSEQGWELAAQAVSEAFDRLPVGTPRAQLIEARDAALAPFRAALAQRREMQRAEVDATLKKQVAALEAQLRKPAPIVHRAPTINRRLTSPR
jgi:hypothetical protein